MRQVYESRAANPTEAKKVNELEDEIVKTKEYYHKRIRELEEKYRYGGAPTQTKTRPTPDQTPQRPTEGPEVAQMQQLVSELEQQVDKLTKERNHFAQKLVLTQQQHTASQ